MNDRKMSRRTALTLTAAAATGAAILADAKPAFATWPTITSPDEVVAACTAVAGGAALALGPSGPLLQMVSTRGKRKVHSFQGMQFCGWDDIETVLLAAAAAVAEYKESLDPKHGDPWVWKKHHAPCVRKH